MTTPTMPQWGELIPDGAVDIFPDGNYGAALLTDDGSRRIVQGAFFQTNPTNRPIYSSYIGHFYGWYLWSRNRELEASTDFQSIIRYMPHPELAHLWTEFFTMATEPVNPAPDFFNWREHLSALAHDLPLGHRFDRLALRDPETRRYPGQPNLRSTEDQDRNGNITQYTREMLGWLWYQVHLLGEMTHLNDWQTFRDWLRPLVEGYCACFERRGSLDRLHIGHDHRLWKTDLQSGKRFLPDFTVEPFGVIELEPAGHVTDLVASVDIENFGNAVDFFSTSKADEILDVWPDGLQSAFARISAPPEVTIQVPVSEVQQQLVNWWAAQWHSYETYVEQTSPALRLIYRRYVEMQVLACLRNVNWSSQDLVDKLYLGRWNAFEYGARSFNDQRHLLRHGWWTETGADQIPFYNDGFLYWDLDTEDLIRDAIEYDGTDPLTAPLEAAMSLADPRVATHIVVVDRDEIDRSAPGIPSVQPWNLNVDVFGDPTGDTTGTPADEYWQGRLDEILGEYP